MIIKIVVMHPKVRNHIKHKTPHKLNFVSQFKSNDLAYGPP